MNRRRSEKKREQDHAEWLARQKRELVELRLQRTLARGSQSALTGSSNADADDTVQEMYSPESGLTLFWDDVVGVRLIPGSLQVSSLLETRVFMKLSSRSGTSWSDHVRGFRRHPPPNIVSSCPCEGCGGNRTDDPALHFPQQPAYCQDHTQSRPEGGDGGTSMLIEYHSSVERLTCA